MARSRPLLLCLLALAPACLVTVDPFPGSDGGAQVRDGALATADGSAVRTDGAVPAGADGSTAGTDAAQPPGPDAALPPDAAADPCASVACGANAHCDPSPPRCVCSPGFVQDAGGACVPVDPGDPSLHTEQQVCDAYRQGIVRATGTVFTPGAAQCDPGTLSREGLDEAVRRLNMFRYFVGLGPVTDNQSDDDADQACSVICAWNPAGSQAHNPATTATCYTALGAGGAGSSNIAWGCSNPGDCMDQWINDWGNETTYGHRRWMLYPPLDPIGYGLYIGGNNYGACSCLRVFNWGNTGRRPSWYAFPPPGFVPDAYASYVWTLHGAVPGGTTAEVTRVSDGAALAVGVTWLTGSYGDPAISIDRTGWSPAAGETYHVKIVGGTAPNLVTIEYDVKPVSCP